MTETTVDKGREAALFLQLVLGLQQAAMVALGKLMNPMSGKIERNLEGARNTIDRRRRADAARERRAGQGPRLRAVVASAS